MFYVVNKNRTRPDRGWVNPAKLPKGPNGHALCRNCGTETKPPRKTFCSSECVSSWKIQSNPQHARMMVWARDHGVCAVCGTRTDELEKALLALWAVDPEAAETNAFLLGYELRFKKYGRLKSLWEADHIVAVVEGGGSCGLDNLRTLCRPCHKAATRNLLGRIKRKRSFP